MGEAAEAYNEFQQITEILTLDEFAVSLKVCPNTVRNWIDSGKLIEGTHYFRAGRQFRFPWSEKQMRQLMNDWKPERPQRPKIMMKGGRQNRNTVNMKYIFS